MLSEALATTVARDDVLHGLDGCVLTLCGHRWLMDWKSWPIYNVLCFTVIPLRLRPMTSGVASMLWNAYVSHQSQSVATQ